MKIAHIVSTFPPYTGGMGNVCLYEADGLASLGHEITVFTIDFDQKKYQDKKKFDIKYLKPLFKYGNSAFVPKIIKELTSFDIIHLHWPFIGGAEAILFWKKFNSPKTKLIVQYHMDLIDTGLKGMIFNLYKTFFNRIFIKQADKILVSSFDYARHTKINILMPRYGKKFIEFPFGVDSARFFPQPKNIELLKRYNIKSDDKIILLVGGLDRAHYFKGTDVLIRALKLIKNQNTNTKVLIVGEGELKHGFQKLSEDLGIGDRVIFTGKVQNNELPQHYNLCDIFTLPSTTSSEAFGLVSLEAMACAKPIVVSDLPGPRILVKNNGLIVKVNDEKDLSEKLNILLNNSSMARNFGDNGRRMVEKKYSWGKVIQKLNKIYDELKYN